MPQIRHKASGTALIGTDSPNGLWCADYKGEFMLGNREYCYPLTSGAYPGDLYTPSPRAYEPPGEPDYLYHDRTVRVTRCGRICLGRRKINLSSVFAGQTIGIREVDNDIWLVNFLEYDLGYFDKERDRVEPGPSPFMPDKVLTMCPEQGVNHVAG